ncbi:membrane-spanning 4-domains subfamily A member 4A-like isoform X1 [Paroedura picta]|uniref:membrane-spanning 4-domains subfamily A member 4A-like isoform X1 n=1 Tax=Paroedura picta TaxID=143630 RepID=UPI0040577CED
MDLRSSGTFESFSSGQVPPSMSRPLKKFYRGEPMALGITQILIGIFEIAFGLAVYVAFGYYFEEMHIMAPFWAGSLYIISGSLSVAAAKKPKIPLVKGALGMNIVSSVAAGIMIITSSIAMTFRHLPYRGYSCEYFHNDTKTIEACHETNTYPYATMYNTMVILFMLTIIEFIITIVSAAFGCASVCRDAYSETTVVIFQNTAEARVPPPPAP